MNKYYPANYTKYLSIMFHHIILSTSSTTLCNLENKYFNISINIKIYTFVIITFVLIQIKNNYNMTSIIELNKLSSDTNNLVFNLF